MSNSFGKKVQMIRKDLGLTQPKFAELVDISLGMIKKYESDINEIGSSPLQKIAKQPECLKYALWLLTDSTNIEAGQIAPGDKSPEESTEQEKLNLEEYEAKFVEAVGESLLMFCHLDWFTPNKDKVNFDDCGKLILKDLRPVIEQRFKSTSIDKQIQSA